MGYGFEPQGDQVDPVEQQAMQIDQDSVIEQAEKNKQAAWNDYSGLDDRDRKQTAQNQISMQDDLDCMMGLSSRNNGVVSQTLIDSFNRKFKFDPSKGMGVFSGRYDDRGNFVFQMGTGQVDANGRPVLRDRIIEPIEQWQVMNRTKVAFSDESRKLMRDYLSRYYSQSELDNAAGIKTPPPASQAKASRPSGGVNVPSSWLYGPERQRGSISAYSTDGRGNSRFTDYNQSTGMYETRTSGEQKRMKLLRRGPDQEAVDSNGNPVQVSYYEDPNGNVVSVRDGEPMPDFSGNGMSERERLERMKELGRNNRASMRNQGRMDIAQLQAELKNRGYDISEAKLKEIMNHNVENEEIAREAERGRNSRADARAEAANGEKFDPKLYEARLRQISELQKRLKGIGYDDDGNEISIDKPGEEEAKAIDVQLRKLKDLNTKMLNKDPDAQREVMEMRKARLAALKKAKAEKARRDAEKNARKTDGSEKPAGK